MNYDYVFDLPLPPSVNKLYFKGRILTPIGRQFCSYVKENCKIDKTITSKLRMDVVMFPANGHKRDVDNILKCLMDSFTKAGIYQDDKLIYDLNVTKGDIFKGGACVVGLKVLEDDFQKKIVYIPGHPLDCLQSYSL